jgi:uncharacterized protein (TIGR02231 family)
MRTLMFFPLVSVVLVAQQVLPVDAPIARVRLHPDEAWVTRAARVHLSAAGTFKVQLESLPNGLRVEDLQAAAKGPSGLRLGDISVASDVRVVTETPEWKKLEAERDALREKRDTLEAQGEAAQQELVFLKGLQAAHDKELSGRMIYAVPNPTGIVELGKSLQSRMSDLLIAERKRKRELEKLSQEEGRINAEFQKRASERRTAPSRVTIEITSAQEGNVDLELSYRVRAARWKPLYEARLSENRKKLDLVLYAAVTQNTGESWQGVRLEISNARPSRSLAVPVYSAGQSVDWVKQLPPPVYPVMAAPAPPPAPKQMENRLSASQTMALGDLQRLAPAEEAVESSASVIEEASGLAATFLVDGAKDVPSDNEPHRFKVQAKDVEPALTVFTTPRLDTTAYLLARFTAPGGLPLFPGSPVVRFAGNQRLGEAPLAIPAAGQPFSLGFGPHKGVRVAFRRVDNKLEEVGAFSKERQWSLREQIELANDGNEALIIEVQDRILKSASDQVKINLQPDFTGGWTEAVPGVRSWKLTLAPSETKRVEMPLTIRAPKDGVVTGLGNILPNED